MAERILLIGMMGAGKSTVGRALAARLGWDYLDSDEQVEAATGRTVRAIFEDEGEAAFRREESKALAAALSGDRRRVVVSVAGGAVLDDANRALIAESASTVVVWLRAPVPVLAARAAGGGHRPLLDGSPARALAALYEVREPIYGQLADLVVDVDTAGPDEVVERIAEAVA